MLSKCTQKPSTHPYTVRILFLLLDYEAHCWTRSAPVEAPMCPSTTPKFWGQHPQIWGPNDSFILIIILHLVWPNFSHKSFQMPQLPSNTNDRVYCGSLDAHAHLQCLAPTIEKETIPNMALYYVCHWLHSWRKNTRALWKMMHQTHVSNKIHNLCASSYSHMYNALLHHLIGWVRSNCRVGMGT